MKFNIPNVRREGNDIVVTFDELRLPPKLFKESRYPNMCRVIFNTEEYADKAPILILGASQFPMELQDNGRWVLRLAKRVNVLLKCNDTIYECGVI